MSFSAKIKVEKWVLRGLFEGIIKSRILLTSSRTYLSLPRYIRAGVARMITNLSRWFDASELHGQVVAVLSLDVQFFICSCIDGLSTVTILPVAV